jgi:hypothetical protein
MRIGKVGFARRFDSNPKLSQTVQHAFGIIRVQQITHIGHTFGQRCQQQHAIGNTFGTGKAHGAVRRHQGREFKVFVLSHALKE